MVMPANLSLNREAATAYRAAVATTKHANTPNSSLIMLAQRRANDDKRTHEENYVGGSKDAYVCDR